MLPQIIEAMLSGEMIAIRANVKTGPSYLYMLGGVRCTLGVQKGVLHGAQAVRLMIQATQMFRKFIEISKIGTGHRRTRSGKFFALNLGEEYMALNR